MTRWRCGVAVLALAIGGAAAADDKAAFDKSVSDSLREVHHVGRELFNTNKDFAGAYRVYQGALLAVKPLLAHRPEVQKGIDSGLAAAEKEGDPARKAFMLHETIENARTALKTAAPLPKATEKKPAETVNPAPPPKPKTPAETGKPAGGPGFRGTVTLKGQPLPAGEVILVSLDLPKPRVFSATIQADGTYSLADAIPAAKYVVIVTGKNVPEKYHTTTTSGLRVEVKQPPTVFNIELK
jgi:hypothetical protein